MPAKESVFVNSGTASYRRPTLTQVKPHGSAKPSFSVVLDRSGCGNCKHTYTK